VAESWLTAGDGALIVESVGDRFRQARKSREYTQEELAAELHISRNSVGMIERGTFRPQNEIIDELCDKLWIDRKWLLTGQGPMERTELTQFYEILKRDAAVREHIKSFIDRLDHPHRKTQAAEKTSGRKTAEKT
jgi:Helix-turn-helix.